LHQDKRIILMQNSTRQDKRLHQWVFFVLVLAIIGLGFYVDHANREQLYERERQSVSRELGILRAQLEGRLASDIQMVRGLVALIVTEPNLDQERFAEFADPFIGDHSQIRNIGAAPDMVLTLMYPLEGNEGAIGLNYLSNSRQRAQAVEARDSGELILAGPLKLIQGGQGIIGRIPVFLTDDTGAESFWGLISVVLDMDKVYSNVGLDEYARRYRLAMRHKGKSVSSTFYGDPGVFLNTPVSEVIHVPGAAWEVAAIPRGGWTIGGLALWMPRVLFAALFLILLVFMLSISRWADAQRRSAGRLKASRDEFASLVGNIPGVTYRFSIKAGFPVLFASDQVRELTGYSSTELTTRSDISVHTLIHPDDHDRVEQTVRDAISDRIPWSIEYRIISRSGRIRWIQDKGRVVIEQNDTPPHLDGFLLDVTDSKRAESSAQKVARHNQALAELTVDERIVSGSFESALPYLLEKVSHALDTSRVSYWQYSADGRELQCQAVYRVPENGLGRISRESITLSEVDSPAYFKALVKDGHLVVDDVSGDSLTADLLTPYLEPKGIRSMLDAMVRVDAGFVGVFCVEETSEARHWHRSEISFLISLATIAGTIISRDKRRQSEIDLRLAKEEAESAAIAKSRFLATMSHEIRTPMNGVLGMLNILGEQLSDSSQKHYVSVAKNSARSLLSIIDDILDFSKIEAGKMSANNERFDLELLVSRTLSSLEITAEEKGLQLAMDASGLDNTLVHSDEVRVRQILMNLVGNAIKFTHEGHVHVVLKSILRPKNSVRNEADHWVELQVSDTGIGMSPEVKDRLFDAFSQADTSTTRKFGGTGLGLAIVKHLCLLVGGEIDVDTVENEGSTFSVRIPVGMADTAGSAASHTRFENRRVLVSCRDTLRHTALLRQLEALGMDVINQPWPEGGRQTIPAANGSVDLWVYEHDPADNHEQAGLDQLLSQYDLASACQICLCSLKVCAQRKSEYRDNRIFLHKNHTREALVDVINRCFAGENESRQVAEVTHTGSTEPMHSVDERGRILVVEDNATNQLVVTMMLSQLGFSAETAENGRVAIDMLAEESEEPPYTLILMDCQMPEMDGFEASRYIREHNLAGCDRSVSIVALTANAMKGDRERCEAAGMNDYLAKPLEPDALRDILNRWYMQAAD